MDEDSRYEAEYVVLSILPCLQRATEEDSYRSLVVPGRSYVPGSADAFPGGRRRPPSANWPSRNLFSRGRWSFEERRRLAQSKVYKS
jgi:hypothetical protein